MPPDIHVSEAYFRKSCNLPGNGRDGTFVIGLLISTNQCITSTFNITDVGGMRPTHCILLCRETCDISVNHSRWPWEQVSNVDLPAHAHPEIFLRASEMPFPMFLRGNFHNSKQEKTLTIQ